MRRLDAKGIFRHFFTQHGQTIIVHNNWNNDDVASFEVRALKNRKDTKEIVFQFAERVDVKPGSVLQIKGSQDFWRVTDTEDHVMYEEFVYFEAYVEKVDELGKVLRSSAKGQAVFNAPVHGGVQVGGHQNVQNISVSSGSSMDEVVAKLVELVKSSSLSALDKEDVIEAAERLPQLAAKDKSPEVIERAKSRLELIKSTLETSKELGTVAAPILTWLYKYFSG